MESKVFNEDCMKWVKKWFTIERYYFGYDILSYIIIGVIFFVIFKFIAW